MLVARLLVARMVNASTPETYMESLCQMMPNVFDSQLWNWGLLAQSQRIKRIKRRISNFFDPSWVVPRANGQRHNSSLASRSYIFQLLNQAQATAQVTAYKILQVD
jgi:hypothetical protein